MINKIGLKLALFAIGFFPLILLFEIIGQNHNDLVSYVIRVSSFVFVIAPICVIIAFALYVFVPCIFCKHFYRVLRLFLVSYFILFGFFFLQPELDSWGLRGSFDWI